MQDQTYDKAMAHLTQRSAAGETVVFTCREWVAFLLLRRRYQDGHDLLSTRELANLRFMRWRLKTGRVDP